MRLQESEGSLWESKTQYEAWGVRRHGTRGWETMSVPEMMTTLKAVGSSHSGAFVLVTQKSTNTQSKYMSINLKYITELGFFFGKGT